MADNNREVLALELRQIIQADRMACDIIDEAKDVGKSIEEKAQKERAAILATAEANRADMEKQVWAEEEKNLASRMAGLDSHFAQRRKALEDSMAQNCEKWISGIVSRITAERRLP